MPDRFCPCRGKPDRPTDVVPRAYACWSVPALRRRELKSGAIRLEDNRLSAGWLVSCNVSPKDQNLFAFAFVRLCRRLRLSLMDETPWRYLSAVPRRAVADVDGGFNYQTLWYSARDVVVPSQYPGASGNSSLGLQLIGGSSLDEFGSPVVL